MVSPTPADKLHIVTVNVFVIKSLYDKFCKCQDCAILFQPSNFNINTKNKIKK